MKLVTAKTNSLRTNLLVLIGICLCVYFSWHILFGERSFFKYKELQLKIQAKSEYLEKLQIKRDALERKVVRLRPQSIDTDLLEERAKLLLGYIHEDEKVIILTGQNS